MKNQKLARLTRCAILIALASVLSMLKIYELPLGGAVTLLSMLPICMIAFMYGTKWGIACSFLYSIIQLALSLAEVLSWGLTPISLVGTFAFDYILPFTLLGFAGVFKGKNMGQWGIYLGTVIVMVLRFACHLVSGTIIFDIWMPEGWANPFIYSVCYNGSFMLPELIITCIGLFVFARVPYVRKNYFVGY